MAESETRKSLTNAFNVSSSPAHGGISISELFLNTV